jgi:hypothetical protein
MSEKKEEFNFFKLLKYIFILAILYYVFGYEKVSKNKSFKNKKQDIINELKDGKKIEEATEEDIKKLIEEAKD